MRTDIKRCWAHGMYETRACLKCSERDAVEADGKVRPAVPKLSPRDYERSFTFSLQDEKDWEAVANHSVRMIVVVQPCVAALLGFFARLHEPVERDASPW